MRHDSLDTGVFESYGDYRRQKREKSVFWRVVEAYRNTRQLSPVISPVIAINPDHAGFVGRKLGADEIEYLWDVELAGKRAVNSPALYRQWLELVQGEEGENLAPATKELIVHRCARLYSLHGLLPRLYFRRIRTKAGRGSEAA